MRASTKELGGTTQTSVLRSTKLAGENIIAYSRDEYPEYHAGLDTLAKLIGARPKIAEEHDGVSSIIVAVEAGRGVALVPSCIACLAGPRLKVIPLTPASPPIIVGALRRTVTVSLAVQKFIAAASAKPAA